MVREAIFKFNLGDCGMTKALKILTGLAVAAAPTAVFAGSTQIPVPEPTSMGILAVAAAGTAVAYRLMRRK